MRHLLLYLIITVSFYSSFSQNTGIGVGTTNPHPSAEFEVNSINKGFLPPRLTTSQRDSINSPASGLQIFNTTTNCLQMYAYGVWQNVFCARDPMDSLLNIGLLGFWPFNGNANDESGNGNNGTVNSATLTADRFGNSNKAYSFDGVSSYINLHSGNSILNALNGLQKFSISFWAFIPSNSRGTIWGHWSNNNGAVGVNCGFHSSFLNGSGFYASNYSGCCSFLQTSYNAYNIWVHVAMNFDGTQSINSNIVKIYVDNSLVASVPNAIANTSIGNGTSLFVGRRNTDFNTYGDYFLGKIDDIRIYNRVLTQAEITYLATH